ncbi:hypothetical protein H0H93_011553 [Arthromyces matolae]|nr:hypothetical protein H0H93_011553 [Arthromyces matolae]
MSAEGPPHPLTLKVMRVSAHSSASITSLQGTSPLPGYPKTLRDLTNASEILTLPSTFGSIQLGESFSSCLCVNNETQYDIEAVDLKVEIQTATTKVVLAHYGGPDHIIRARNTFETIVHHEIKELGQHVLACAITYRVPAHLRQSSAYGEKDENNVDPSVQTFRKFYKFAVLNPLSVKTKVHMSRSPSALFSSTEREKVFLEVHIQNLTQGPLYFEKMNLECVDQWDAEDANVLNDQSPLFAGPQALMQSQDTRQYIYILTPKLTSLLLPTPSPGSVIPLGRLEIFWRSSFGEPGRLLTSMLSRKIPIPASTQAPVSALPSRVKRTVTSGSTSRPHSPQLNHPGTPPPRPSSAASITSNPRPQLPSQPLNTSAPELDVNLLVRGCPSGPIRVEEPFTLSLTLVLSTTRQLVSECSRRRVQLIVQRLKPPKPRLASVVVPSRKDGFNSRHQSSGLSTPSSVALTFNYALAHQKLSAVASPLQQALNTLEGITNEDEHDISTVPPSYFKGHREVEKPSTVLSMGLSTLPLPLIELDSSEADASGQIVAFQDFELTYLPTQKGFTSIGGFRVVLVHDRYVDDEENSGQNQIRILKEWDVITEIWVSA